MRVWVVDDDSDLTGLIREVLETAGYRVDEAQRAPEALEKLHSAATSPPDVLLVDVLMPGMSGVDLVKDLRRDPRLDAVAVVFMTGDPRQVAQVMSPADRCLAKPFAAKTLLELLRRLEPEMDHAHPG